MDYDPFGPFWKPIIVVVSSAVSAGAFTIGSWIGDLIWKGVHAGGTPPSQAFWLELVFFSFFCGTILERVLNWWHKLY